MDTNKNNDFFIGTTTRYIALPSRYAVWDTQTNGWVAYTENSDKAYVESTAAKYNNPISGADAALEQIYKGIQFTYHSFRKPGRIYSISVIERESRNMGCDLFVIRANDLKKSSGTYNKKNITEIINKALNNQPQRWRIN